MIDEVEMNAEPATRVRSAKDKIRTLGLVPIVELVHVDQGSDLIDALSEGGLPVAEITLRTSAGEIALEQLVSRHPHALLGAGTVRTLAQARRMVDIGVSFVVSPGTNEEIINYCVQHDVLVLPGVCTPTEVMRALDAGAQWLKIFPAEVLGGVRYLQALAGPFSDVNLVPSGGINSLNLSTYLQVPQVMACGGSWMVASELLASRRFDRITELTLEARAIVDAVRDVN